MKKAVRAVLAILLAILVCCAIFWGWILYSDYERKQKIADAKAFIEIYQYIAAHEDQEFAFVAVAEKLNLSEDALYSYLSALERAKKIQVAPKYLARKPIIISRADREWYYHRVTLPHTAVPEPPGLPLEPVP